MIETGSRVSDIITGFTGIVTARTEWLYGCIRVEVTPQELHEGKPVEALWFDEQRVRVIQPAADVPSVVVTGGDRRDPMRADPVRQNTKS
jgi:hypothetical protein